MDAIVAKLIHRINRSENFDEESVAKDSMPEFAKARSLRLHFDNQELGALRRKSHYWKEHEKIIAEARLHH